MKKRSFFKEFFTFTYSYLHLFTCIKCLDIYLDFLVDFYVLAGECVFF